MVHDLVDAIEGVFLVYDCVEQDTQGPDVLLFATVGGAGEDFGGGVIWGRSSVSDSFVCAGRGNAERVWGRDRVRKGEGGKYLTNRAHKHIKRPTLNIRRAPKIN
jgi:hypothetical protein